MNPTMTEEPKDKKIIVPPPPRTRRGIIAEVPQADGNIVDNLSKPNTGLQDMNFKMDADFHRAFKVAASMRNMAMKEMLEASFRCWVEHYGDPSIQALLPPKIEK